MRHHRQKHDMLVEPILYPVYFDPWLDIFDDAMDDKGSISATKKRVNQAISTHEARMKNLEITARRLRTLIENLDEDKNLGFYVEKTNDRIHRHDEVRPAKLNRLIKFQQEFLKVVDEIAHHGFRHSRDRKLRDFNKAAFSGLFR